MANNGKNKTTGANLEEISTIRDILMGQHISTYDSKFDQLQQEITALKEELEEKIKSVDHFHKFAMIDFVKESNTRFNNVEKQLAKDVANLEQKIKSSSAADKKEMGRLMAHVGKKLMGE